MGYTREINVGRLTHLSSREVDEMCSARHGVEEITDACAVTIASFYQSPGVTGKGFAALASGRAVDVDLLLENIHYARTLDVPALPADEQEPARHALDMLATWALSKVRQSGPDPLSDVVADTWNRNRDR